MNYKKIIRNQETRFAILQKLRFVPSKLMLIIQYYIKLGEIPNIKNGKRFNEKIQWYKLNYRDPQMTVAVDKYRVREYIKSKNLDYILVKLYGVYARSEEIDYSELPEKFVMKTTDGSGTNIICENKESLDENRSNKKLNQWLSRNHYAAAREWAYKNVEPHIVIEEYLENNSDHHHGINDYKFFCFNGEPHYIVFDVDRYQDHKRNIYDLDWNLLDVRYDEDNYNGKIEAPQNLREMIEVARKLSEDFPFVRVDLYSVNNKIYFGELTFYPLAGYGQFTPESFDYKLGELFNHSLKEFNNKTNN